MRRLLLFLCAASLLVSPAFAVSFADVRKVQPTSAPWVVSLWGVSESTFDRQSLAESGYVCTGALISPTTVVTAAHCFTSFKGSSLVAVQGQTNSLSRGRVLMPRDFAISPKFNSMNMVGDIAIVDLYQPIEIKSYLKLPTAAISKQLLKQKLSLYGWGQTEASVLSLTLRKTSLENKSKQAGSFYKNFNVDSQIAAGRLTSRGFSTACKGDSGAPLVAAQVVNGKSSTYLLGVVSYGSSEGCAAKVPAVFTRVSSYAKWLKSSQVNFKLDRSNRALDVERVFYSVAKGVLTPTYGEGLRSVTLRFATQGDVVGAADIQDVTVNVYQAVGPLGSVEFRIQPRNLWPTETCGWAQPGSMLTLFLADNQTSRTSVALKLKRPSDCSTNAFEMTQQLGNRSNCSAQLQPNADGSTSIWLNQACLPTPQKTRFRLLWQADSVADVEPGFDLWAGPLDLSPF